MVLRDEIFKQIHYRSVDVSPEFANLLENCSYEQLYNRKNFKGHITASGAVIHLASNEILLLRHKFLDKWLIPGGHVDLTDDSIVNAALREVEEETGLTAAQLIPLNVVNDVQYCVEINSHPIPKNDNKNEGPHYHHDFRFVFSYTGDKQIKIDSSESLDYKWVSIDDVYLNEIFKNRIINF